ncbi:flavin reductase family protein [Actinomadura graeca]|uniref:flavin reductase family protein n=1 Tax=Actinomadura graeca TaxID=2750812 RepID=UPI001E5FF0DA|nr:flavin reductase family protein [Actinomadura graeca]
MNQFTGLEFEPEISQDDFRTTMSRFASGLTVVAALDEAGLPAGLTCQSFASLSLDPPLILVCVGRGSSSWARIEGTGRFGVSILAEQQRDVCVSLARRAEDKFDSVPWRPSPYGTVHIEGALATIDCRIGTVHEAGDHLVVIGDVLDLAVRDEGTPLLYFRGRYGKATFRS